jgi:branched-subunit amino acid transport protein
MTDAETLIAIVGLALVTLLTRGAFLLPRQELPLPGWVHEALRHAPLAALAAVVVPEIVMSDGALIDTWRDPRPWAAGVGVAWFFWRRSVMGTLIVGMAAMLALRLGLGW